MQAGTYLADGWSSSDLATSNTGIASSVKGLVANLPHATEALYDAGGSQLTPTVWVNHSGSWQCASLSNI